MCDACVVFLQCLENICIPLNIACVALIISCMHQEFFFFFFVRCCWSFYSLARLFWRSHSVCHIREAAYSAAEWAVLEPAVCLTECWRGKKRVGRLATGPSTHSLSLSPSFLSFFLSIYLSFSILGWPLSPLPTTAPVGSHARASLHHKNLLFSN